MDADYTITPNITGTASRSCSVMCCGCRRFLAVDGGLIDLGLPRGGVVPLAQIPILTSGRPTEGVAEFIDAHHANTSAKAAGWQIEDAEGENHRCPECVEEERKKKAPPVEVRRGAIIHW